MHFIPNYKPGKTCRVAIRGVGDQSSNTNADCLVKINKQSMFKERHPKLR